jgi:hypothetical protein
MELATGIVLGIIVVGIVVWFIYKKYLNDIF